MLASSSRTALGKGSSIGCGGGVTNETAHAATTSPTMKPNQGARGVRRPGCRTRGCSVGTLGFLHASRLSGVHGAMAIAEHDETGVRRGKSQRTTWHHTRG